MKNVLARTGWVKVLCVLAAFIIIPASTSFGDDFVTSVGAGEKAVLFTFSGLSTLGAAAYNGGLGAKYYIADPFALRISIPFSYANQSLPANAGSGFTGTDGYTSGVRVGLSAAAEYHFLKTRVSPYAGGGLGVDFTSTTSKPAVVVPTGSTSITTTTDNRALGETVGGNAFAGGTSFMVGLLGGVEFFIVKELSLSAEYQFGYSLNARSDQVVTTVTNTGTTSTTTKTTTKIGALSQFGISNGGALTLSVYF